MRYLKDNRLLPRGFDKATAEPDLSRSWAAPARTPISRAAAIASATQSMWARRQGPFQVDVELRFQPIGFRWAQNLKPYDAPEPKRFVSYYDSMSAAASEVVAQARVRSR